MQPKTLKLLEQCIETGLRLGYNRAHKHCETPTQVYLEHEQLTAILNEIDEWFEFPEIK